MLRSGGVVLLLSHEALERFKSISAGQTQIDNVLLEWTLAIVLFEINKLDFVFPVFCGDYREDSQGGLGLGSFDFRCPEGLPDVVPKVTIVALNSFRVVT